MCTKSSAISNPQQYHCTAALSSSADAPIIWSRANGSVKLPMPKVPITKPTTISTKAGIGVQSICSITKVTGAARTMKSIFVTLGSFYSTSFLHDVLATEANS